MLNRLFARYTFAVAAVAMAFVWRLAMVSVLHAELPTYLTFYPAVMLVALLAGQWAGLVATALSALVVDYWILPPVGQFAIEKPADAIGLALFSLMGVFMCVVAERYRRSRERAAASEKELALQKSNAALAESEQQYRTLFTNMSEGFCIIEVIFDAEGRPADYRFLKVNAAFERQTGLHEAEGKLMRELAPAHEAHWFKIYGKIALTGEPARFENEARALNRWYDVSAYRVGEPEKRQVAIIFNDISVHKRAEEALRRQADMLRLSFDAIIVWRLDSSIESWNVGAERLYGFSESEASGRVTHELLRTVHPKPWPQIEAELREKGFWEGELRHRARDGREVIVSARKQLIRDANGVERILETNRDITERKRSEEALRASEDRWSTTLRSIGDAVIATCAKGLVIFMNEVAEKLTGWPLAEAQGRYLGEIFNIVNEVTRIKPENPVTKVIQMGQVVGLANHTALISRSGAELPIEDSGAPIRDKDGQVTGVVLVFHDISEKRMAEKALRDSERLATTGRLAATLAHEIHNPLDTVGNLLYLINHDPDVPETVRPHASLASEELARVTQMTRHMLSFQREATKPGPIKIGEVLDNVIALYERKIESAGIQVQKEVEFEGGVLGLPGEMRQVFANLIGNAIEAIGKNGKIRLHAYLSADWRRGRRGLRVTVADNGPGIPAEIRGKIFEPFFTTKGEAGTGLGLWITSGIVEKNDGALRLRSVTRAGRTGTCFSVFFPVK